MPAREHSFYSLIKKWTIVTHAACRIDVAPPDFVLSFDVFRISLVEASSFYYYCITFID